MARKPPARSSKKKSPKIADAAQAPEVMLEQVLVQVPEEIVPEPEQIISSENAPKQQPRHKASGKQVNIKPTKQVSTPVQESSPMQVSSIQVSPTKVAPAQAAAKQASAAPTPKQTNPPQASPILPLPQFLAQKHGFHNLGQIFHNLSVPELYEHILFLREGVMSAHGAVMVETTPNTKLAVRDKFIVEEGVNKDNIAWGEANRAIDQAKFNALKARAGAYLQRRNVYVQDCFVGSDMRLRVPFRIVTESAWQSLFVRNTFAQALPAELRQFEPRMTIVVLPNFKAIPEIDGTRAETFVLYDFSQRLAIIGGTRHAEEIKKAVFTVMSYAMPLRRVLPMRCAATVGANGDTVLLFGTNGAGKTTLAANPSRMLIGDDAHGWGDEGIFAFEQGSYAKAYNITPEADASIHAASKMFGTILENVKFDITTRQPLFNDASITDNARVSYTNESVSHVQPIATKLRGTHAKTVIFLVNDAFGVLPPVARLTHEQAIFFYLSGYAAKNPVGMDTKDGKNDAKFEPKAVFSAGFGETFMVQDPVQYAQLFRERLRRNNTKVWLVNTGWQGGTQATGSRIKRDISRAIVSAISSGALDSVQFATDSLLHLSIPASCPNVSAAMLNPRNAWADKVGYDKIAQKFLSLLAENFKKYSGRVDKAIVQALSGQPQQPSSKEDGTKEVILKEAKEAAAKEIPIQQSAPKQAQNKQVSAKQQAIQAQSTPKHLSKNIPEIAIVDANMAKVDEAKVSEVAENQPSVPPSTEEFVREKGGKKSKVKAKVVKKGRAKSSIPDDDEADVGDTGSLADVSREFPENEGKETLRGIDSPEDDIYIPPSLFASEQGEYRPDNEEMTISSAFDDNTDDDDDDSESSDEVEGDIPIQGQSQYRGRRRRGGRGRRRPR